MSMLRTLSPPRMATQTLLDITAVAIAVVMLCGGGGLLPRLLVAPVALSTIIPAFLCFEVTGHPDI